MTKAVSVSSSNRAVLKNTKHFFQIFVQQVCVLQQTADALQKQCSKILKYLNKKIKIIKRLNTSSSLVIIIVHFSLELKHVG